VIGTPLIDSSEPMRFMYDGIPASLGIRALSIPSARGGSRSVCG
jgi:hypothetical protein